MDKTTISRELFSCFKRVHHYLKTKLFKSIDQPLKPSHFMVLMRLLRASRESGKGERISDIAAATGMTLPGATQIIKALEQEKLVLRQKASQDKRSVLITLSDQGKAVMQPALEKLSLSFSGLFDYLGEQDSQELLRLMQKTEEYFAR